MHVSLGNVLKDRAYRLCSRRQKVPQHSSSERTRNTVVNDPKSCGMTQERPASIRPYFQDHGKDQDEAANGQDSARDPAGPFLSVKCKTSSSLSTSMQSKENKGQASVNFRLLMPERTEMDVEEHYNMDTKSVGKGAFGAVYLARDKSFTNRRVAIKQVIKSIHKTVETPPHTHEIEAMRTLDHPNVCKLFEVFSSSRKIFFIMEFCEGGDLFDWIIEHKDNKKRIPEATTTEIIRQVASVLSYAHMKNIAHRDLKPENICFASKDPKNYAVKVIDWGLSEVFEGASMLEGFGTPDYQAPEVHMRNPYNCSCDLWSLGVVMYIMLCGKPPFWGERNDMVRKIKRADYPMKKAEWSPISNAAKDLVKKLLEPKVDKRLTAARVLEHEWLQTRCDDVEVDVIPMRRISSSTLNVLGNIHELQGLPVFRSICMAVVARHLDYKQLEDIHTVFAELDKDKNGFLTEDEISAGFCEFLARRPGFGKPWRNSLDFLQSIDLNGDGRIEFTEFCTAALSCRPELPEEALWGAFKTFDNDGSGGISLSEMESVMKCVNIQGRSNCEVCKHIMHQFDIDGNGVLDFTEFKDMMHNKLDDGVFGACLDHLMIGRG